MPYNTASTLLRLDRYIRIFFSFLLRDWLKGKLCYLSGEGDLGRDLVLCCHLVSSQGLVLYLPVLVESAFGFGTELHRHLQQIKTTGWRTHQNSTEHRKVHRHTKLYWTTPELYCTSKGWRTLQNSTVHQKVDGHKTVHQLVSSVCEPPKTIRPMLKPVPDQLTFMVSWGRRSALDGVMVKALYPTRCTVLLESAPFT